MIQSSWRRIANQSLAVVCVIASFLFSLVLAYSEDKLPPQPLICLWEHDAKVEIGTVVREVGFNTVWTHDPPYTGQKWEDTLMYRHLQTPGVKYVIAKVDRTIWGWTHEQSLRHAGWVAELSLTHKEIIGLYLNDYYDEIDDGGRTPEKWAEIIAKARSINPKLALWVPLYPPGHLEKPYDFDHDAIIMNIYDVKQIPNTEKLLVETEKRHPGKPIVTGLYVKSDDDRWMQEEEFRQLLSIFIKHINEGKTVGLRIFRAADLKQRPEYMTWAKEVLKELRQVPAADSYVPKSVEAGSRLFVESCSDCHGIDGRGSARGSDLRMGLVVNRGSDEEVAQTIRHGVPNSSMPAFALPEDEIRHLVAFIRSLSTKAAKLSVHGNPDSGKQIFFGKASCSSCHMIRGRGGLLGPDLSNLGAEHTLAEIRRSVLSPNSTGRIQYRAVTVITQKGEKISGTLRNRDSFSLQLMDTRGELRSLQSSELREVILQEKSTMPDHYGKLLSGDELQDLLAFLSRQTVAE